MFHVQRLQACKREVPVQRYGEADDQFVVELLTVLRRQKFSIPAWWRFMAGSWQLSKRTAREQPGLKKSWLRLTVLVAALAIAMLLATFFFEGSGALRLLPGFLACATWQQSDLFWHLGLNHPPGTRQLLPTLGPANTLTWLRGLGTCYLLGRLMGGIGTPSSLVLLTLLATGLLDILDGQVARLTKTQSKLGQLGDGEVDACLYLAITLILLQNSVLAPWLAIFMLMRFCLPLLAALASYFAFAHPLRFGSTAWGKCAGLAQCLYLLVLLAPPLPVPIKQVAGPPLLVATLVLLIAAPMAQIAANIRA
jgi:phosphatidylglycerophosphate synthase